MPAAYLEKLNSKQRRAVEHGVQENACVPAVPLLVIAGAGSGKTNTLAHRVAHFIVNGADPRRILLMTFSRRAAGEMTLHYYNHCGVLLSLSFFGRAAERRHALRQFSKACNGAGMRP